MPPAKTRVNQPTEPTIDDQMLRVLELVEGSWPMIAAAAWQGYVEHGRGSLMLDFAADFDSTMMPYVPAANLALLARRQQAWSQVASQCEVYEPTTEVVFVFNRLVDADVIASHRHPTPPAMPTPPVAFREFVRRL
jgi:hypothetical protein